MSTSNTASPKEKYCRYTLDQLRESALFTPERFAEISTEVKDRLHPVYLANGAEVPHARFVETSAPGKGWLHPRVEEDHQWEHAHRTALAYALTDAEFDLVERVFWSAWNRQKEKERFEKAAKIPVSAWSDGVFIGDSYFSNIDEALDHIASMDEDRPAYAWAAKSQPVVDDADAAEYASNFIDSNGWEDMSVNDLHGVEELQHALELFRERNSGVLSFTPDHGTAICIPE